MGDSNHPHQLEAFGIFQQSWQDSQQSTPHPTSDIISQAADKLAAATVAKGDESGAFLYSALSAIVDHASQSPASLDLMLQTYRQAADKLPNSVIGDYGSGKDAAIGQLNWWIVEEAGSFSPPLQYPQHAGKSSAADTSNPQFQQSDVADRVNEVLERVREWRQQRLEWTVMSAAMGRCYGLDLVRGNEGKTAIAHVDSALNITQKGWSEAQFVGTTVMLRGCAKSLAADTKVTEWVQRLEALLHSENVSFTVKSHSEVSVHNPSFIPLLTSFCSFYSGTSRMDRMMRRANSSSSSRIGCSKHQLDIHWHNMYTINDNDSRLLSRFLALALGVLVLFLLYLPLFT